ncbi:GyrI-like domain-containing protein [Rhodopseudomonas palustris]|nr:GyrI-like domain-containing protein [Rhodopseudomonas palustris]
MNRHRFFHPALLGLLSAAALTLGAAGAPAQTETKPAETKSTETKPAETTTPPPAATTPSPTPAPSAAAPATPAPSTAAPATPAPATPPAAAETPATPPPAAQTPAVPPAAKVQTADPFGEEITLAPKTAVVLKGKASWDNAFESLIEAIKSVTGLLEKQGIKPNGNPMIVYTSTDDNGFTFQAEIPVPEAPKNLPKIMSMGPTPDGKVLKFVHRGSYDNMDNTYEAITNHLDDKKIEAKDTFVEEYITDPLTTAEDKLVINVYVPMK